MRIRRLFLVLLGFVALAPFIFTARSIRAADAIDTQQAQRLGSDAGAAKSMLTAGSADELGWQWFIWLNTPLTGADPKVWEGWRQSSSVYLPNGAPPAPWGQEPAPPQAVIAAARQQGLNTNLPFHNLDSDVQSDGLALRDNFHHNVRYQILMNQDTFNYILQTKVYNVNGQQAMAQANTPLNFPATAFEIKTSWIWIGTDKTILNKLQGKYYIVNAYYALVDASGLPTGVYQVGRAALSGMHIIAKPVPQWFWVTFQNVYDAQNTQSGNELPIAPDVQQLNQKYRGALQGMGSIFANYQLMGTQWQFVDSAGKPLLLANSQIESAFQRSSSCATCHSTASYSVQNGYFNQVKEQDGGITYYTGEPPTDKMQGYNPLDFVWSLRRAQWQR
jgi:mono/diheme cytochrome c family protein